MHLEKIELVGFKSFADKTEFHFDAGITGIVGPNGCGKSNIVDCIKWTLGDQSSKSLRGTEMLDVIFNGSETRSPMGCAEATLLFSNEDKLLPLEYDNVAITRRLYRSGESEYLINKQQCRLKDIKELFMGTGIGNDSYSIIEQSRIEKILQANPKERRFVFEEASGISRYKSKKKEAESKLERVTQDMLRLNDITSQLQHDIRSLKIQATKAQKFKELSLVLKEKKTVLALHTYHELLEQKKNVSAKMEELFLSLAEATAQLESMKAQKAQLDMQEDQLNSQLQSEQQRQMSLETRINTLQHRIQDNRNRIAELSEEQVQKQAEYDGICAKLSDTLIEQQEAVAQKSELEIQIAGLQKLLSEQESLYEEYSKGYQDFVRQVEEKKEQSLDNIRKRSSYQNQLTEVLTEIKNLNARQEKLLARQAVVEQEIGAIAKQAGMFADEKTLIEQDVNELKTEFADKNENLKQLLENLKNLSEEIAQMKDTQTKLSSRKGFLEELEAHQEGISQGVKNTIAYVKENIGIHSSGMLSELIEVDSKYIKAIENCLAEKLQFIVAESSADTAALVNFLTQSQKGRATIAALSEIQGYSAPWIRIPAHPDVVGRAYMFVNVPGNLKPLIEYLLADYIIVKDIDTAYTLITSKMTDTPLVTLAGEIIDPKGITSAGPQDAVTSILSRKFELKSVSEQLVKLELRLAELEVERHDVTTLAGSLEETIQKLKHSIYELSTSALDKQKEIDAITKRQDLLREEHGLIGSEKSELQIQMDFLKNKETSTNAIMADLDKLIQDLNGEIGALTEKGREYEQRKNELSGQITSSKVLFAETQKHKEAVESGIVSLEESISGLEASKMAVSGLIEKLGNKILDTQNDIAAKEAEIVQSSGELTVLVTAITELKNSIEKLDAQVSDLAGREQELSARQNEIRDNLNELKIEESTCNTNIANLEARIKDDLGTDINEIYRKYTQPKVEPQPEPQPEAQAIQEPVVEAQADSRQPAVEGAAVDAVPQEAAPVETVQEPAAEAVSVQETAAKIEETQHEEEKASDPLNIDYDALVAEVEEIKRKLQTMENVNLTAIDQLKENEERFGFLKGQEDDLKKSKESLEDLIRKLNRDSRETFVDMFEKVRANFNGLFRKLFGGGKADIILEENVDILDAGIEIYAKPPGKELTSISLLSGGEKALVTVALIMSIFMLKPSVFCILDEADAPLDESNIERFISLIKEFTDKTQFLIISHNKKTVSHANAIYGITMQEKGVSTKVSVKLIRDNETAVA